MKMISNAVLTMFLVMICLVCIFAGASSADTSPVPTISPASGTLSDSNGYTVNVYYTSVSSILMSDGSTLNQSGILAWTPNQSTFWLFSSTQNSNGSYTVIKHWGNTPSDGWVDQWISTTN